MLLIYTPEDEPREEFIFRPAELMSPEAEALEACGGPSWDTFEEFGRKFLSGNLKARRAALWIMLKRRQPKLRFADLVVRVDELDIDYEEDERARIRARIEGDDMDDEQREQALALLDEGRVDAEPEPVLVGKGPAGDDSTDSP